MPKIRLLAPAAAVARGPQTINGRSYAPAAGTFLDVDDSDAEALCRNGWLKVALVGPTASRPVLNGNATPIYAATPGSMYVDTSLGKLIVCDGTYDTTPGLPAFSGVWRDAVTGAIV